MKMIKFDKNDEILSNIARIVEKRLHENIDIELLIDKSMDELDSKFQKELNWNGKL